MPRPRLASPARLPLRVRLVAGFSAVMVLVLAAVGGFVYWRVQVALDRGLTEDLDTQTLDLRQALERHPADSRAAIAALPAGGALDRVLAADGTVLAATGSRPGLLRPDDLRTAAGRTVQFDVGRLLLDRDRRVRVRAFPVGSGATTVVAVTTVRLGPRDEALRELLAQLTLADLAALAIASLVSYRLARAALLPVERYRARAEQIASGATGLRLDVPAAVDDEVTRLGHTLNLMLEAIERAAEQQRQFLADASHELRTPLALLSAEVELALRRPRTAAEHEQTLTDVSADVARLSALADQLLDLERASATSVGSGTADAVAAAERAARRAQQRVGSSRPVSSELPPRLVVAAPAPLLDRVLGNLVDNAVHHGAGTVRVLVRSADALAVLSVSDDGAGPPADFVPHAVERFRRGDDVRTGSGSGLGLARVHALAVCAGGELRLCSAGAHHRYPPLLVDAPDCEHSAAGTTVSVVLGAVRG